MRVSARVLAILCCNIVAIHSASACDTAVVTHPFIFKWGDYVTRYAFTTIDTETEALAHWVHHGFNENRQGSPVFHALSYAEAYPEVVARAGSSTCELAKDFLTRGFAEGKVGAPFDRSVFNWQFYAARYPGLSTISESEARQRWARFGMRSGEQANFGFHSQTYLELNPDIRGVAGYGPDQNERAMQHWQMHGQYEKRFGTVQQIPMRRVGIMYSVWHALAASAQAHAKKKGDAPTMMDILLRRQLGWGAYNTVAYMLFNRGLYRHAEGFHYHNRPTLGFYSLYTPRPGESSQEWGPLKILTSDSRARRKVARTHADQLIDAGVDFIFVDATNFSAVDPLADKLSIRPIEVLFQQWAEYRAEGYRTPQIAIWGSIKLTTDVPMWSEFKKLYENPSYDSLLLRDPETGQRIFFLANNEISQNDQALVRSMRDSGIMVIPLWGLTSQQEMLDRRAWSWMSPCTNPAGESIVDVDAYPSCNQTFSARRDNLMYFPSAISVSASYQTGHASHGDSSGYRHGRTMRKQFQRAFELRPDYLLINSWNEHIAQPQAKGASFAAGLKGDVNNHVNSSGITAPDGRSRWTDLFGAEYARDIEPTSEWQNNRLNLLKKCLHAYRVHGKRVLMDGKAVTSVFGHSPVFTEQLFQTTPDN